MNQLNLLKMVTLIVIRAAAFVLAGRAVPARPWHAKPVKSANGFDPMLFSKCVRLIASWRHWTRF
jgi:hypothetical protein